MANPWDNDPILGQAKGPVYGPPPKAAPPPTPLQIAGQELQVRSENRQAGNVAHDNAVTDTNQRINNPQALRKEFDMLPAVKNYRVATQQLSQALMTGEGPQADLALTYAFAKAMDPDSVVREGEAASVAGSQAWIQAAAENVKKQFGMDGAGNYTPEARTQLRQQIIRATASRDKLYNQARSQFEELAKRNGIDPFEVVGNHAGEAFRDQFHQYDDQRKKAGANLMPLTGQPDQPPPGVTPAQTGALATPDFGGGGSPMERATDQRLVGDPETQAHADAMLRAGASYSEVNRYAVERGMAPVNPRQFAEARRYLRSHPNYQGSMVNAHKYEPVTTAEKVITTLGDNPVGAYLANAGQFLSGNTLDNLAADPERARQAMDVISIRNPNAATAGQISGGVMSGLAGEAGLARAGMASGIARGTLADLVMGGANGAGSADDGSRLAGAAQGAAAAGLGSFAGQGAMKVAGRALAPSGGSLADLYQAGVRPTVGQRVADTGVVGHFVNKTEEALQSVPIVGSAIRGARQEARDQFQVGAFNESLKEIGEALPKGMKPGTDPHKFTQAAFDRVYDKARSGMTMVADKELSNDLGTLAPDIATLGPQAQNKLKAIMANHVSNRVQNGQMSGDAYKRTMSDLGKHIARLGKSQNAEDQQLAEILKTVEGSIDAAARRSSNPDAVALLDAADAGYAKLVRIENAAKTRGGDAGTFSPANFDSAVQKDSGGVRSKAYLRGDALMQDYAKQGRSLEDKLPNSGTTDRAFSIAGLGFGALMSPVAIPYAPGVRKIVGGAMAPNTSARANAISVQLKKRARLVGAGAAASGVAALPGTTPGQ